MNTYYHANRFCSKMKALRDASATLRSLEETNEADLTAARELVADLAEKATAAEYRMRAEAMIDAANEKGQNLYLCELSGFGARVMADTNGKRAARRFAPRSVSHNDVKAPRANATTLGAFLRMLAEA